jgi:hypothetical protein
MTSWTDDLLKSTAKYDDMPFQPDQLGGSQMQTKLGISQELEPINYATAAVSQDSDAPLLPSYDGIKTSNVGLRGRVQVRALHHVKVCYSIQIQHNSLVVCVINHQ